MHMAENECYHCQAISVLACNVHMVKVCKEAGVVSSHSTAWSRATAHLAAIHLYPLIGGTCVAQPISTSCALLTSCAAVLEPHCQRTPARALAMPAPGSLVHPCSARLTAPAATASHRTPMRLQGLPCCQCCASVELPGGLPLCGGLGPLEAPGGRVGKPVQAAGLQQKILKRSPVVQLRRSQEHLGLPPAHGCRPATR